MSFHLKPYRALVIGASGTIGGQWVKQLKNQANCQHVAVLSRQTHSYFDLSNESSIEQIEGTDHVTLVGTLSPLLFFKGSTSKPIESFVRKLHGSTETNTASTN